MTAAPIANGVIVAENDALMRDMIRGVLLRAEQLVFPVADGAEAVTLARQFRARLVMLDISMPRLNGLQACEAIRALPGYAAVPIVMLTGHGDPQIRLAAQRIGANDFITKPFRPQLLLVRLAVYLDVPAHLLPAQSISGDETPADARAQVWNTRLDSRPPSGEDRQLTAGFEILRMLRKLEGHK